MFSRRVHRFPTYLLAIVMLYLFGITPLRYFAEASDNPAGRFTTSALKPFIKKIDQNYGSTYAAKVKELFGVFLDATGPNVPEEERSFLEFNVLKMKVVDNKMLAVKINSGDTLRTRDTIKIAFTPRKKCFLYLFRVKATGIIYPLFPRRKFSAQTNPLTPNLTYFVPPMKKWLPVGKDVGKGAIIVFVSIRRNHEIEKLMEYFTDLDPIEKLTPQTKVYTLTKIPIINRGIGGMKEKEMRDIRLPFDEFGQFVPTEFFWNEPVIVVSLWYQCR